MLRKIWKHQEKVLNKNFTQLQDLAMIVSFTAATKVSIRNIENNKINFTSFIFRVMGVEAFTFINILKK